ncbi:MAG TPA: HAD family hydrolase [Tissierellia bacterium]|nr:HAD family hydrolase [Tissierellia bacterium]
MHKYKAIFFDRDGTLTKRKDEVLKREREMIEKWSGKPFVLDYDRLMRLFDLSGRPQEGLKSIEEEIEFTKRYYRVLLKEEGVTEDIDKKAESLFQLIWLKNRELYPETMEVLRYFKSHDYKIGVISDTSPSLQKSLEVLGAGKYIDSYICSDLVGAMKPNPKIYQAALDSLNVKAEESIYVDDYAIEADGARKMGFTSFYLDRKGDKEGQWVIYNLKEVIEYVENKCEG